MFWAQKDLVEIYVMGQGEGSEKMKKRERRKIEKKEGRGEK